MESGEPIGKVLFVDLASGDRIANSHPEKIKGYSETAESNNINKSLLTLGTNCLALNRKPSL